MERRMTWIVAVSTVMCVSLVAIGLAAGDVSPRDRAEALTQQGRWQEAARAWEAVVHDAPREAQAWAYLGMAYRHLDRDDAAIGAYERAIELDAGNFTALAGMAIVLEQRGELDRAFDYLTRVAKRGTPLGLLEQDPAFEGLREHPRFQQVVEIAERASQPCLAEGPYDDFDFWIGDWDVHIGGEKRAENEITKELNGCIIRERFHNRFGYRGESINYYDPESGLWKQNWVDVQGGVVRYSGALTREGVMSMEGTSTSSKGQTQLARVTWTRTEDGGVHHVIEQSADGGETWKTFFDGRYVRSDR